MLETFCSINEHRGNWTQYIAQEEKYIVKYFLLLDPLAVLSILVYYSCFANFNMMKHTFLILPFSYEHIINDISGGGKSMFTIDMIYRDHGK